MSLSPVSLSLAQVLSRMPAKLQQDNSKGREDHPARYFLQRPQDTGAFVLPLKQSFIKDARLMPGTRIMLALLVGWAGQGRALELTKGTIAKHIGRSSRQVFRYVQDAAREGYLRYSYTKNRLGMITGLRVWLRFDILRHQPVKSTPKQENPAMTQMAPINKKDIYTYKEDTDLEERLDRLRRLIC